MNQKEIKELIEFLVEKDIAEFELERGEIKLRVKRGYALVQQPAAPAVVAAAPVAAPEAAPVAAAPPVAATEEGIEIIKSPIVGTFYESPSPGSPPFVRVGERVQPGKVLCIIESMKLMNEIEAECSGLLESKLVMNGQPVEYGEALFAVRTV